MTYEKQMNCLRALMMKFFLLCTLFLFCNRSIAQDTAWVNYLNTQETIGIKAEGADLWVVFSRGGLLKMNSRTLEKVYYNPANSGISSSRCLGMSIAPDSTKWIFTSTGFSGLKNGNWKYVDGPKKTGLPVYTQFIEVDQQSVTWVCRLNGTKHEIWKDGVLITDPILDNVNGIYNMFEDSKGRKWFPTRSGHLLMYDNITWRKWSYDDFGLPASMSGKSDLTSVNEDKQGTLWITSQTGIVALDGVSYTYNTYLMSDLPLSKPNDEFLYCTEFDRSGNPWVGTKFGILSLENNVWTFYQSSNTGVDLESYSKQMQFTGDTLWIVGASDVTSIIRYDGNIWTHIPTGTSPVNHYIKITNNDKWSAIWNAGPGTPGFLKLSDSILHPVDSIKKGLTWYDQISAYTIDATGKHWFGVNNSSVFSFDGNSFSNAYDEEDLGLHGVGMITSFYVDPMGILWVTTDNGIAKFDGNTWHAFIVNDTAPEHPNNYVFDMVYDGQEYFLAMHEGISRFDGVKAYPLNVPGYKPGHYHSVDVDANNDKWFASIEHGLIKLSDSVLTIYDTSTSLLSSNIVKAVFIDSLDRKWVGTSEGLWVIDGQNWTQYTSLNSGLASNDIVGISMQDMNNIWIHTHSDITYLSPAGYHYQYPATWRRVAEKEKRLSVYPNPFNDRIYVSGKYLSKQVRFELYDPQGKKIMENVIVEDSAIDLQGLRSGIYLLKFYEGSLLTETHKIIKE